MRVRTILLALVDGGPMTARELARATMRTSKKASRDLLELVDRGLVNRAPRRVRTRGRRPAEYMTSPAGVAWLEAQARAEDG